MCVIVELKTHFHSADFETISILISHSLNAEASEETLNVSEFIWHYSTIKMVLVSYI